MVARLKPKKNATSARSIQTASGGAVKRIKPDPDKTWKAQAREARQTLFRYHQFISHYLKTGGNGTKAAILAGYAPAHAAKTASDLTKVPYIAEKIRTAQARMAANTEVSTEKVILELAKVTFANMSDYVRINEYGEPNIDLSDLDPDQWAAIAEVQTEIEMRGHGEDAYPVKKVKIKLHDKLGSADKILRYLGAFNGKRGSQGEPGTDAPEQVTNKHYTLQIGNATINVGGKISSTGPEGAEAKVLTLP